MFDSATCVPVLGIPASAWQFVRFVILPQYSDDRWSPKTSPKEDRSKLKNILKKSFFPKLFILKVDFKFVKNGTEVKLNINCTSLKVLTT